jgi:hypothetical protein
MLLIRRHGVYAEKVTSWLEKSGFLGPKKKVVFDLRSQLFSVHTFC